MKHQVISTPLTDYRVFSETVDAIRRCGSLMKISCGENKKEVYQNRIQAICRRVEHEFDDRDGCFVKWLWNKSIPSEIAGSSENIPLYFGSDRKLIFTFLCFMKRRKNGIYITKSDLRYFYTLLKEHCPNAPKDMFRTQYDIRKENRK